MCQLTGLYGTWWAKYREAWLQLCEVSRRDFQMVYKHLGIHLEEKGESFYNPYISGLLEKLTDQGLIVESEGARVIHLEGFNIPLIVVKINGSYNYASTYLAALWYRVNEEKAEWIIYVTDVGQQQHFHMIFKAATLAGWLPDDASYPKVSHVGFGLVLGEDGKRFRTRSSDVVRLVDLLVEAKSQSKASLVGRGKSEDWAEEELEQTAVAVGYGAVKYADLENNRLTNYTFDFKQMLNDKVSGSQLMGRSAASPGGTSISNCDNTTSPLPNVTNSPRSTNIMNTTSPQHQSQNRSSNNNSNSNSNSSSSRS